MSNENNTYANAAALAKRGYLALEDGKWYEANGFFNRVLDIDAEYGEAFLGLVLAENKEQSLEALKAKLSYSYDTLVNSTKSAFTSEIKYHLDNFIEKNTVPGYLDKEYIRGLLKLTFVYESATDCLKARYERAYAVLQNKNLERAIKYSNEEVKGKIISVVNEINASYKGVIEESVNSDRQKEAETQSRYYDVIMQEKETIERMKSDAIEKREQDYKTAVNYFESKKYREARELFKNPKLINYKDSNEYYKNSRKMLKKKRKKKLIISLIAIVIIIAAVISFIKFKPLIDYTRAKNLIEKGNYSKAVEILKGIDTPDYKDSKRFIEYAEAMLYFEKGDSVKAAMALGKMGDFYDAQKRSFDIWGDIVARDTLCIVGIQTVGLKTDGTVVMTEHEDDYQYYKYDVEDWTDIVAISAGGHLVGLKSDGTVVATGDNDDGECDVENWTDIVAISAGGGYTVGLKSDGTVVATGYNHDGQCNISGWTDIVAISTGSSYTVGIKSDGTVLAKGSNYRDQCDVAEWKDITAISAGYNDTIGLKSDGTVVATGVNDFGKCDVEDWTDIVAISAGGSYTVGLKSDGTVVATGDNDEGQCDVENWTDIVAISTGSSYTVGLKSDGTVVAAGDNYDDQCDVSDLTDIKLPKNKRK